MIQDTYVEGCADMYFDELLWRSLVEFVRSKSPEGRVGVIREGQEKEPVSLDAFLKDWDQVPADDQYPPPVLTAMSGEHPVLCMVTDYWARVGGPDLYHDSYTYSLFSARDVGAEVMAVLAASPSSGRWTMNSEITTVTWARPSPFYVPEAALAFSGVTLVFVLITYIENHFKLSSLLSFSNWAVAVVAGITFAALPTILRLIRGFIAAIRSR